MDAENLEFPDEFDVVMAQYVVTAVPNPEKALDEFARVLRPGGELIILTRVSADAGMRRFIEQRLQPVVRPLGFRTAEFAWSRYAQWLAGARGIELAERRLVPPLGHFSWCAFARSTSPRRPDARALPPASYRRCDRSHVNFMMSHAGHRISVNTNPKELGGRE